MRNFIKILPILFLFLLTGCSSKSSGLYNLSAQDWYKQINKDIKENDLDKANEHYISFSSEHIASPLLEKTLLILAAANTKEEDYIRANNYLDEYIKRFGTYEKIEFAYFLKIKANYDSFTKPNRNQGLMDDSIFQIHKFLDAFPNSQYRPLMESMLVKFKFAQHFLDMNIRNLYERTGKKESAKIYEDKLKSSPFKDSDITPPKLSWYRVFFE